MLKTIQIIFAIIGAIASTIAIFHFITFKPLPEITGLYSICYSAINGSNKDRFMNRKRALDLLYEIQENADQLVFIDIDIFTCDDEADRILPRYENKERETFSYSIGPQKPLMILNNNNEFIQIPSDMPNELISKQLSRLYLTNGRHISQVHFGESGAYLEFFSDKLNYSQFSQIKPGVEGTFDVVYGVFTIKRMQYGSHYFEVAPQVLDESTRKKVECRMKKWGKVRKFLQCPFI